jgi:hypothetical protein
MAEDALQKKWIAWDLMLRRERGIDRVERGFVRGAEFGKRQHAREDHASAFCFADSYDVIEIGVTPPKPSSNVLPMLPPMVLVASTAGKRSIPAIRILDQPAAFFSSAAWLKMNASRRASSGRDTSLDSIGAPGVPPMETSSLFQKDPSALTLVAGELEAVFPAQIRDARCLTSPPARRDLTTRARP